MALTFTKIKDGGDVWGKKPVSVFDVTLDSSYPATPGYVINARDVGHKALYGAAIIGGNQASGAGNIIIDTDGAGTLATSVALRVFVTSTGVEVANGVSLATYVVRLAFIGL